MLKCVFPSLAFAMAMAIPAGHAGAAQAPDAVRSPPSVAVAKTIQPGSWDIRYSDQPARLICVTDVLQLMQLAHPGLSCSRLIIEDEPKRATIHYSCTGAGWGRTTLVAETPRLVQIDSQGIVNKSPFAFRAEARRSGECDGARPRAQR